MATTTLTYKEAITLYHDWKPEGVTPHRRKSVKVKGGWQLRCNRGFHLASVLNNRGIVFATHRVAEMD